MVLKQLKSAGVPSWEDVIEDQEQLGGHHGIKCSVFSVCDDSWLWLCVIHDACVMICIFLVFLHFFTHSNSESQRPQAETENQNNFNNFDVQYSDQQFKKHQCCVLQCCGVAACVVVAKVALRYLFTYLFMSVILEATKMSIGKWGNATHTTYGWWMDRVVMVMMDDGLGQEHGHTHTHLFISQYWTLAIYYLWTYYTFWRQSTDERWLDDYW